jgi:hypothetical protein
MLTSSGGRIKRPHRVYRAAFGYISLTNKAQIIWMYTVWYAVCYGIHHNRTWPTITIAKTDRNVGSECNGKFYARSPTEIACQNAVCVNKSHH